jgi:hypothetical protein
LSTKLPSSPAAKKLPLTAAVEAAARSIPHKTLLDAVGEEVAIIKARQAQSLQTSGGDGGQLSRLSSLEPDSPPRRQKRAAAVKAASRSLEFATTGEWPADDDDDCTIPITSLRAAAAEKDGALLGRKRPAADEAVTPKEDHHSDSAEEEAWGPASMARHSGPAGGSLVAPHLALKQQVGESSSAAIGLLAMSLPEEEVRAAEGHPAELLGSVDVVVVAQQWSTDGVEGQLRDGAEEQLGGVSAAMCPLRASFERMCWAKRSLPEDKSPQLKRLLQRAAMAYCSAIEAEAPVLETARQLAAKQAVLSRSLSEALRANNELETYIRRQSGGVGRSSAQEAAVPPPPCPKRLKKTASI